MTPRPAALAAGTVHEVGGGVYRVRLEDDSEVSAALRGRLKRERRTGDRVVIGDRVALAGVDDAWTIEGVEPRRNELVRRGAGGRHARVVAANLDHVLVVIAAHEPTSRPELVDRFLVVVEACDLHPRLVINKVDLPGAAEVAADLRSLYTGIGYEVLLTSARTGIGMGALESVLCRGVSALIGPSGAGKSSLLNAVDPTLKLRTGALSRKLERGRHTTVSARMIALECGGWVADTPGFSDVGLWRMDPARLEGCFPEFEPFLGTCRFRGCAHLEEPDCAIKAAVEGGVIAASRYRTYATLMGEARESRSPSSDRGG